MTTLIAASTRQLNLGWAIQRAVTGAIFLAHGARKLFVYGVAGESVDAGTVPARGSAGTRLAA